MQAGGDELISVGMSGDGALVYRVALAPSALPAVRRRDLEWAWSVARQSAIDCTDRRGAAAVRLFRFERDGHATDLVLADADARLWADAIDRACGLGTRFGLSVCLRLLGLLDLIASERWATAFCLFRRDGADVHPALVDAAAHLPLTADGRLDQNGVQDAIRGGKILAPPETPTR